MSKQYITIKIWKETYRLAKILSATLGESLLSMLNRLVREECRRKGIKQGDKEIA